MILLDMDGVIVDIISGCKEIFGEPEREDTWNIHEWWGLDNDTFWKETENEEFWSNLNGFDRWASFYNQLISMDKVILCTTPRLCPHSFSGKFKWIEKHFGRGFEDFIFTTQKHLLARPGVILIDDFDGNIDNFRLCGGEGILVPRSYNKNRQIINSYEFVLNELTLWK